MEDPRHVLAQRIRQKLDRIDQHREKLLHALEVIKGLDLSEEIEGLESTTSDGGFVPFGANGGDPLDRDDLSLLDASIIVTKQEGRPLSVPEIATRLIGSSFPYEKDEDTLRRSLSGVLGRWARKGEKVFRPETGKYAPMEWKGDGEQLSIED
jgi:hypothetical protein